MHASVRARARLVKWLNLNIMLTLTSRQSPLAFAGQMAFSHRHAPTGSFGSVVSHPCTELSIVGHQQEYGQRECPQSLQHGQSSLQNALFDDDLAHDKAAVLCNMTNTPPLASPPVSVPSSSSSSSWASSLLAANRGMRF